MANGSAASLRTQSRACSAGAPEHSNHADRSPIKWTMRNYELYICWTGYRRNHQRQGERSSSPTWPRPDTHLVSNSNTPYQGRQGPRAKPLPETDKASASERQLKRWPQWREPDDPFVPKQSPEWNWPPAFFVNSLD